MIDFNIKLKFPPRIVEIKYQHYNIRRIYDNVQTNSYGNKKRKNLYSGIAGQHVLIHIYSINNLNIKGMKSPYISHKTDLTIGFYLVGENL
jgi:hypothetical protein